jgi:hypothetical protein
MRLRNALYIEELKPLIKYGGILTKYCQQLYNICSSIKGVSRVPFPEDCKFEVLDPAGRMMGANKRRSPLGHLELTGPIVKSDRKILIPFPAACCDVQVLPQARIKEMADGYYAAENVMISNVLLYASIEEEPKCVQAMRAGRKEVLRRLKEDSHTRDLTSVLWPSASLPGASFSPNDVFVGV